MGAETELEILRQLKQLQQQVDLLKSRDMPGSKGWVRSPYTWVRVSNTSFKIVGIDVRYLFPVDAKVWWQEATVSKWALVIASAMSGSDTLVTIVGSTMAVSPDALSAFYSYGHNPQGWPTTSDGGGLLLPFTPTAIAASGGYSVSTPGIWSSAVPRIAVPISLQIAVYLAAANDAANYWNVLLKEYPSGVTIATLTTQGLVGGGNRYLLSTTAFGVSPFASTSIYLQIDLVKVLNPGAIYPLGCNLLYR